jgi:hypothetical protein
MTPTVAKKKRPVLCSIQTVAINLDLSLDAVLRLVKRGRLKARRVRSRLSVSVMSAFDGYAIDYDSAFAYQGELLERRRRRKMAQRRSGK